MILTTTPSVEGRQILEYKGIIFGEVISGVDVLRDFTAGLSNFFGGRSGAYEEELTNARETALRELEQRAQERGANAVVGVDVLRDFTAGLSNFFGGRSGAYEEELTNARETALRELEQRAQERGANAVVGVDVDYEVLGSNNGMLMVTASGTAVLIG